MLPTVSDRYKVIYKNSQVQKEDEEIEKKKKTNPNKK